MRKALIAIVVAAGLFAVGAFAAEFALNSDDVASGEDAVESCATSADVEWTTDDVVDTDGDYRVVSADVTLTPVSTDACAGATADIAVFLDDGTGWVDGSCDAVDVDGVSISCDFGTGGVKVAPLTEVSVLVNGNRVQATSTGL